ncbi:MAG: hypothetical protein NT154_18910, partial [Verrucomicrobia bacterium]|nr:hypothetical protein [Verrucomicrobiota bacterium]
VTNRGTIVLNSTLYNCSASLTVGGTLVNAPEGVVQVNVGAGNNRTLNANVINQGTINVEGGISFYCNGAGKGFRQQAGSINGTGWFTWAYGEFDFVGGALFGAIYVRDGMLDVAPTAGASTIYTAGNTTLLGNRSTQATVWVQGNAAYGHATLTTAQGAVNAGTLRLESSVWNCMSVVAVGGSNLVNTATGVIVARAGEGNSRSISGYLINQGVVDGGDYYLDLYVTYEAAGGRMIGPARLVHCWGDAGQRTGRRRPGKRRGGQQSDPQRQRDQPRNDQRRQRNQSLLQRCWQGVPSAGWQH